MTTGAGLDNIAFSILLSTLLFCISRSCEEDEAREHEIDMFERSCECVCGLDSIEDTDSDTGYMIQDQE